MSLRNQVFLSSSAVSNSVPPHPPFAHCYRSRRRTDRYPRRQAVHYYSLFFLRHSVDFNHPYSTSRLLPPVTVHHGDHNDSMMVSFKNWLSVYQENDCSPICTWNGVAVRGGGEISHEVTRSPRRFHSTHQIQFYLFTPMSSSSSSSRYESSNLLRKPRSATKSPPPSPKVTEPRTRLKDPVPIPSSNPASQYTLLEKLGTGSFGVVYKAMHNETKQIVAIKQIGVPQSFAFPSIVHSFPQQTSRTRTTTSQRFNKRSQVSHSATLNT